MPDWRQRERDNGPPAMASGETIASSGGGAPTPQGKPGHDVGHPLGDVAWARGGGEVHPGR